MKNIFGSGFARTYIPLVIACAAATLFLTAGCCSGPDVEPAKRAAETLTVGTQQNYATMREFIERSNLTPEQRQAWSTSLLNRELAELRIIEEWLRWSLSVGQVEVDEIQVERVIELISQVRAALGDTEEADK